MGAETQKRKKVKKRQEAAVDETSASTAVSAEPKSRKTAKKVRKAKKTKKPPVSSADKAGVTENVKKDDFQWDTNSFDTDSINPDEVDVSSELIQLPTLRKVEAKSVSKAKADSPVGSAKSAGKGGKGEKTEKSEKPGKGDKAEELNEAESANAVKVNKPKRDEHQITIPGEIGILALRNVVVFPGTVIPLAVGRPRSRRLITSLDNDESEANDSMVIGTLTQKDPATDKPGFDDLYTVGTAVTILKKLKLPDEQNSLVVHGLIRFRVVEWISDEPFLRARIEVLTSKAKPSKNLQALTANVRRTAERMIDLAPNIPDEVNVVLSNIEDPGALADFLAANINIPLEAKQEILESLDVNERLEKLSVALAEQLELLELSDKIHQQVSKSIDKTQREYFLQEQLKAIQSELGHTDQKSAEIDELRERIDKAQMPEKVLSEALRELDRLSKIPIMSPEFGVSRTYVEWLCDLPWAQSTKDKLSIPAAKRVLNADHYGLTKVKKRILEFLAVRKLNPEGRSPILCLVGPPGVGKTSLGRSIARAMGRKFIRISLGGMRDEAEIRGHRRTYIGAMPGRVIQELRKCGSNNPVFMLDEIDKIGADFRGDPASALLEVLDPEQNNTFSDHYIDQPFDLSRVIFIATANYMGPVPAALRDRMEVLELPGYTTDDKTFIAEKYLIPRQLKENGLSNKQLTIKPDTLNKLIESYTREAGVRELDRKIAGVCRAIAIDIASGKRKSATVNPTMLNKLLGPTVYESELALRTSIPGVATGLAYTPVGGEILFIEATQTLGTGKLILTGQLGEVMKESAQTALSVLKSLPIAQGKLKRVNLPKDLMESLTLDDEQLNKRDIHVHVPAGAVPKDGPSAGLALFTALASLLSGHSVRHDVAMTGEMTLTGMALPIGGVKEKVIAAKRAGIKTVILPERNRKDLQELPKHVLKGMKFEYVRSVEKVLQIALVQ